MFSLLVAGIIQFFVHISETEDGSSELVLPLLLFFGRFTSDVDHRESTCNGHVEVELLLLTLFGRELRRVVAIDIVCLNTTLCLKSLWALLAWCMPTDALLCSRPIRKKPRWSLHLIGNVIKTHFLRWFYILFHFLPKVDAICFIVFACIQLLNFQILRWNNYRHFLFFLNLIFKNLSSIYVWTAYVSCVARALILFWNINVLKLRKIWTVYVSWGLKNCS